MIPSYNQLIPGAGEASPPTTPPAPSNRPERKTFRITRIPSHCKRTDIRNFFPGATIQATSLGYSPYSDYEKCATVSFDGIPTILENVTEEQEITVRLNGVDIDVDVDPNFFGFTTLNEVTEPIAMDVIAVTGLGGHAFGSWKERGGKTMWLRDMLPKDIPNIRVLIYGFNSNLENSKSFASITDFAGTFLELVFSSRSLPNEAQRPIVFICHSLGGLVVKEALSQCSVFSKDSALHNDVFTSTYGAIMFGVPNRGLQIEDLRYIVEGQPNERLVSDLARESNYLQSLHEKFIHNFHFKDSEFISCWETKVTASVQMQDGKWKRCGAPTVMVTKESATYAVPHEATHKQHSIDSDHSAMVKITRHHGIYHTILRYLRFFVQRSPDVIRKRFLAQPELSCLKSALDSKDWDLQRALNIAAWNGNHAAAELLLTHVEVNWEDERGRTALYWAALNDRMATSKLLLDNGANGNATFYQANRDGNDMVMKHLRRCGVTVDSKNTKTNALHRAAIDGDVATVMHLIMKGDNWHIVLLEAAQKGEMAVIKLLLQSGAKVNEKDINGAFPLHIVVKNCSERGVRLLLESGADIEAKDNNGMTALILAASLGEEAVVRTLVEMGADIEARDNLFYTALIWAALTGKEAVVRTLVEMRADIEGKDNHGRTALIAAAGNGKEEMVRELIEMGADKEMKDNVGRTALIAAADRGKQAVVRALVEMDADKEAKDNLGNTALIVVAENGQEAMVRELIEIGADKEMKDNLGRTALKHATDKGYDAVARLLE